MAYNLMGSHCDALVILFSHNDDFFLPLFKFDNQQSQESSSLGVFLSDF